MGKKDTVTKEYISRSPIFADVFNQFIYHGEQIIQPEQLRELDTTQIALPYGSGHSIVPVQKYRDIMKLLAAKSDGQTAYCILAIENESKINYAMPVKNGLYDFLQLTQQVSQSANALKSNDLKKSSDEFLSGFRKGDRILPVITLVLYFDSKEWDAPVSLREMYSECDDKILALAPDYHINLIAPYHLTDCEINQFQTNLREILKYIKYSNDKNKLNEILYTDNRFRSVEKSAVDIIRIITGSKFSYPDGKEEIDMCLAIEQMREESELIGEQRGMHQGQKTGELIGAIRMCQKMGLSKDSTKQQIEEVFSKSDSEALELIEQYWKD